MAVLDSLPGIEVTVRVDGEPLEEYADDEPEITLREVGAYQAARTVSKYIESITDKEFSVELIFLDGTRVRNPILQRKKRSKSTPWQKSISGIRSGEKSNVVLNKFKFGRINTTTDDAKMANVKEDTKRIYAVGEIVIRVYRQAEAFRRSSGIRSNNPIIGCSEAEVHEKALKGEAKSHVIGLGTAVSTRWNHVFKAEFLDGIDFPIAIFKFKYRSKDALKSLLIIKPTPDPDDTGPLPSPAPVSLDNLTQDQRAKLDDFLRELVGNGRASNTPDQRIKREREEAKESSRKKIKVLGEVKVLNLTGND